MEETPGDLGTVLVLGGGGFLGTAVVERLLETGRWTSIVVSSRNPNQQIPNISYRKSDICDEKSVTALIDDVKPRLVVHLVSPRYNAEPQQLYDCNVKGTSMFLDVCQKSSHVKALLYTSTNRVIANSPPAILTEDDIELFTESSKTHPYCKTKAIADAMVLAANGDSLKTAILRVPIVYGGRDQHMEVVMDFFDKGQQKMQLGDNRALFEIVNIDNAAHAHVLAAKALLSPTSRDRDISGHAFSITDGNPMGWYDFARKVWAEAGDKTTPDEVKVVPFWVLFFAASTWEWLLWLSTLGMVRATKFNWYNINTMKEGSCVLDISKAEKMLGYSPIISTEEGIRRATKRALSERKKA
ncbi:NAD(P)-binding protein [Cucurbitaria berberidis CBS 394.84]|uniref:NAD(P)-binding protein n=1 Tax=Cucurbitaria berberidis CBS 394.84 TaxID=1168544 RepID=A0A9P4GJ01_9PLEO|nr:NAD(P)-binding protein [Cucurbitaria berberidis CBS 394.84]KAF1846527.1 NAD(P)-binding protein [Cucurbitaria berberidis CBS 394.84]